MGVAIITDSVSSLPKEFIDEYSIDVVTLYIVEPDQITRDVDVDPEKFYERIARASELPTTSQPTVDDFASAFRARVEQGLDVLAVLVSEKMSGTIGSARIAADRVREEFAHARIEILDTEANTMQEGMVVLAAAKLAKLGHSIEECISAGMETIRRTRFLFSPETLDNLRKGGRIGRAKAFVGGMLNVKPILTVEKGEAAEFGKARSVEKARVAIAEKLKSDIEEFGLRQIYIQHIGAREAAEKFARDHIAPIVGYMPMILPTSSIAGVHVGITGSCITYECEQPIR